MFEFEEIKEKFLKIPLDVQESLVSYEVDKTIFLELSDKYKLQYDETEKMAREIGYVMLGLKPMDNFVENIQKATKLNEKKSRFLVQDINEKIFKNIRESLRKIHNTEEDEEDLDENQIKEELFRELEKPKENTSLIEKNIENSEIIKTKPEDEKIVVENKGKKNNYSVDPYREVID